LKYVVFAKGRGGLYAKMAAPVKQRNAIVRNLYVRPLKWAETLFLHLRSSGKRKLCHDLSAPTAADPVSKTKKMDTARSIKSLPTEPYSFWKDKSKLLLAAFVLVTTFMVYCPCLQYGFVNWDDTVNIYKNPDIINISDWGSFFVSVKNIFSIHLYGNFNPLTITSFAFEKLIVLFWFSV